MKYEYATVVLQNLESVVERYGSPLIIISTGSGFEEIKTNREKFDSELLSLLNKMSLQGWEVYNSSIQKTNSGYNFYHFLKRAL